MRDACLPEKQELGQARRSPFPLHLLVHFSPLPFLAPAAELLLGACLLSMTLYVLNMHILPVLGKLNKEVGTVEAVCQLFGSIAVFILTVFFFCFECLCNFLAELCCLGDRRFYEDWYNSSTFTYFSRTWNRPVHSFLLQHVYLDLQGLPSLTAASEAEKESDAARDIATAASTSSTSSSKSTSSGSRSGTFSLFHVSRSTAFTATFLFSILLHELVLIGALGWSFPYLAVFSLLQLPLAKIMQLPLFKGKRLGNIIFW